MTKEELLEKARRDYPIGTKYTPAHILSSGDKNWRIIMSDNFKFTGCDDILADGGEYYKDDGSGQQWNTNIYWGKQWAKILSLPPNPDDYELYN